MRRSAYTTYRYTIAKNQVHKNGKNKTTYLIQSNIHHTALDKRDNVPYLGHATALDVINHLLMSR